MKVLRPLGLVLAGAACLLASPAAAVDVDQGAWSRVYSDGTCTSNTNTWTCTYDMFDADCQEASVGTGTGVRVLVQCSVTVHATVTAEWRVNAAGRRVGCTSVALTGSGFVSFNSNVSNLYDNAAINQTFEVDVRDGVVEFEAAETINGRTWVAQGRFPNTCTSNSSYSTTSELGDAGPGTVTVQV